MTEAKFITFEGIEGAGKSTQILLLQEALQKKGVLTVVTREPGGTLIGEKIRELLLHEEMHEITELLLMFAARAEHIEKLIKPALQKGEWVLCDRFTDSSFAYQGFGRGIALEKLKMLKDLVQQSLKPNVTFWFDIPVEIGLKRAKNRTELDRFECEEIEFFKRVSKGYAELYNNRDGRFVKIDATKSVEEIHLQIMNYFHE